MILGPDEGSAADESSQEGAAADPATAEHPLGESSTYMAGSDPEEVTRPLGPALERLLGARPQLTMYGRLQAIEVRAAESATPAAQLELSSVGAERLGKGLETRVLREPGRILIWIAGAEEIEPDSKLGAIAVRADGQTSHTVVEVEDGAELIEISLPWDFSHPPVTIALLVEKLRSPRPPADSA